MNKNPHKKGSLRTIIIGNVGFLGCIVLALCGYLIYASAKNQASIVTQQRVNGEYLAALALDEAIDDVLYYGAELSNSLSDESYDAFLKASAHADEIVSQVMNGGLKEQLKTEKASIVEAAIGALDAYVVDDRAAGDAMMQSMRAAAAKLDRMVEENAAFYEAARLQEERAILGRANSAQGISIAAALLLILLMTAMAFLMWRTLFQPIEALVSGISHAAADTQNTTNYKLEKFASNEIGAAAVAFNRLLDAVAASISEARLRADEAEIAERRWKALFNESPDAIVLVDPKSTEILDRNPATDGLFCMNSSVIEANGGLTALEIHPHEVKELKNFFDAIKNDGCARNDTLSCAIEDRKIPVSVVGVLVPHGIDTAILLHIRDISAQREYEEGLKLARQEAEQANVSKSNFLANMSHEIRTPMNGVMGMAEILERTELTPKQKNFVSIIVKSSNALLTIINDILDFSKIDSGQVTFANAPFNLKTIVEDVMSLVSTRADEKDLELIVRYQPKLIESFIGDDGRIRQILMNLIGNAIKFTSDGFVLVDISGSYNGSEAKLNVRVQDTGIGIPANKVDDIFEKFNQVDNSATRQFEGTGLGLAICRMLIEKMGGNIGVESELGNGSTFWFEISLPIDEGYSKPRALPLDVTNSRVLIVDDNPINREILIEQLTSWELSPKACSSASEAFQALDIAATGENPFDLIIMDYQMPQIDGIEAIQTIRQGDSGNNIPAILLTSVCDDESRKRARNAGIEESLTKPARSSDLFDAVVSVISENRLQDLRTIAANVKQEAKEIPKTAGVSPEQSVGTGPRVLVAEDNEVNQAVISEILTDLKYDYLIAENGKEAVDQIDTYLPDVILMDVSMPVMNGLEATAEIRKRDAIADRKSVIIGLTANALQGDREKCMDAGMDDYLSKPVSVKKLDDCLRNWLRTQATAKPSIVARS